MSLARRNPLKLTTCQTLLRAPISLSLPLPNLNCAVHHHVSSFPPPSQQPTAIQRRHKSRLARKSGMSNMNTSRVEDDIGLIPHLFIRPPARDLPSWFGRKTVGKRMRLEWVWLKTRMQNFASLLIYVKFAQRSTPKHLRIPLALRDRPGLALSLHRSFYTALAARDTSTLSSLLCQGLGRRVRAQLQATAATDKVTRRWKAQDNGRVNLPFGKWWVRWPLMGLVPGAQARVVADLAVPFPVGDAVVRQCVVRVRSWQRVEKLVGKGGKGEGWKVEREGDLDEYIVLQQMRMEGMETRWKVWGTMETKDRRELGRLIGEDTTKGKIRVEERGEGRWASWNPFGFGGS